ncbi:unnamed protein product [Onchocerca flexuosa]|uniref:Ubiquitin family protein n=1 Tax=Onchocerca flexuosa TaxID=387005 RepID=A0A183HY57_9BILA|nr:unnamed protein product [Onchocerca flexuosa]
MSPSLSFLPASIYFLNTWDGSSRIKSLLVEAHLAAQNRLENLVLRRLGICYPYRIGKETVGKVMKLYVKRVNAKGSVFTVTVDSNDTVAGLKERIGGILDLFPDAVRLLYQGHPLSNTEASLGSYGIEDSSRINVIYVPSIDMNPTVSKVLSNFLYDQYPPNMLPVIAERYQVSLAKKVKSFSLEELERYAKFRNQHIS